MPGGRPRGGCSRTAASRPSGRRTVSSSRARRRARSSSSTCRGIAASAAPGGEPMWSSNGMLAVSDGGTVIYDAQGQQLARFPGQPRAWSPDGSLLAVERAGSLMVVGSDGSNAVTVVRRLVSGSSRLVPDFVAFTPDGQSIAYDATGRRPEARSGHRRAERHASGLRRVVCRLRALRVRAAASRRARRSASATASEPRRTCSPCYRQAPRSSVSSGRRATAASSTTRATPTTTTSSTRSSRTAAGCAR